MKDLITFLISFPVGALFVSCLYRFREGKTLEAAWMLLQVAFLVTADILIIATRVAA